MSVKGMIPHHWCQRTGATEHVRFCLTLRIAFMAAYSFHWAALFARNMEKKSQALFRKTPCTKPHGVAALWQHVVWYAGKLARWQMHGVLLTNNDTAAHLLKASTILKLA